MNITHNNHYVPQWLQRRFFKDAENCYYYLDLKSPILIAPNGKKYKKTELRHLGSKQCFSQEDLYTILISGQPSDEIEKYLFGRVDDIGAKSLPIILNEDWQGLHPAWKGFIEFLDAQKHRTPRALSNIKNLLVKNKLTPSQEIILQVMQRIRQKNITMWAECEWEIVSAREATLKFILTDEPVTFYNPACFPQSEDCRFPYDPNLAWKGTRTIFPLDLNHCLILTHLEYAKNPKLCKPKKNRTNARHFERTIFNLRKIIRGRQLSDTEVTQINYIMKSLATRYIAASEKDHLYPEKYCSKILWPKFNKVLLPETKKISNTSFTFIGWDDGTSIGFDPFGRVPPNANEIIQEVQKKIRSLKNG